jgi:hypothetical protein
MAMAIRFRVESKMTFKSQEILKSAGIDIRNLAKLDWPASDIGMYGMQVEGAKALAIWERLRSLTEYTGLWPLVVGDDQCFNALKENYEIEQEAADYKRDSAARSGSSENVAENAAMNHGEATAQLIAQGDELDLQQWFKNKVENDRDYLPCHEGTWPVDLPNQSAITLTLTHKYEYKYEYTSGAEKPLTRVNLLLLPSTIPWHVPALLRLGGSRQCPQTEIHVAVLKSWNQRYGAEIVSASSNVVEMRVGRPPKTRDEALKLAREQAVYCGDLVHGKYGSLSALAATLIDAPLWSFTWN